MNISLMRCVAPWAVAALISISVSAQAQENLSAFSYVSNGSLLKQDSSSVSSWKIQLNKKMTQQRLGANVEIPMPDGEVLIASVKSHKEFDNGDVQVQAGFGNDGHVILTMGTTVTYGSITSSIHNYSLSVDESGSAILIDNQTLPANSIDLSDDIVIPEAFGSSLDQSSMSPQTLSKLQAEADSAGLTYIDMLFVYSAEFRVLFQSPETRINQLIAFSNTAFENTGILINLRMVGAVEIGFTDSDGSSSLLNAVRSGTGAFSGVPQLRNEVGADLVATLGTSSAGSSGIAFIFNGSINGSSGFSFTRLSANCCDVVFTHEIGHNLGSGHQRAELLLPVNFGISPCTGGFTGFSCGHSENENGSTNWSTIMASGRSINRMNMFSNLTLNCDGAPCGIAEGQAGAADNRTSFNITRLVIGAFRDAVVPTPGPSPTPNPGSSEDCSLFIIRSANDASAVVCI